jgi:Co/Zn/Cd efflux system component
MPLNRSKVVRSHEGNTLMHTDDIAAYTHEHVFDLGNPAAERGTRAVMWITAAMMIVEITGGWWLNSMALLADGWHIA